MAVSNSLGLTLIETVVALSIFASAGTAVLIGLSAAHKSSDVVNASAVAENLARNQMEYVWTQPYQRWEIDLYNTIDDGTINLPSGFGVSVDAVEFSGASNVPEDGCIEKVVVTVLRDSQPIHVLETLRTGEESFCS